MTILATQYGWSFLVFVLSLPACAISFLSGLVLIVVGVPKIGRAFLWLAAIFLVVAAVTSQPT